MKFVNYTTPLWLNTLSVHVLVYYSILQYTSCIPSTTSSAVALLLMFVRLLSVTLLDVLHTYIPWSSRCTFSITSWEVMMPAATSVLTCTTRTTDILLVGVPVEKSSRRMVSLPEILLQKMEGRGWPWAWQAKEELEWRSAWVVTGGEVMLAGTGRGKEKWTCMSWVLASCRKWKPGSCSSKHATT